MLSYSSRVRCDLLPICNEALSIKLVSYILYLSINELKIYLILSMIELFPFDNIISIISQEKF